MLTNDYINHFSVLAMLLDIVPDCPDAIADLLVWQPRSYAEHVASLTFTDPAPLLAAYAALAPAIREPFDTIAATANAYGARLIAQIARPDIAPAELRSLCLNGRLTMAAFIQRLNGCIGGQTETALAADIQAHIDALLAGRG